MGWCGSLFLSVYNVAGVFGLFPIKSFVNWWTKSEFRLEGDSMGLWKLKTIAQPNHSQLLLANELFSHSNPLLDFDQASLV